MMQLSFGAPACGAPVSARRDAMTEVELIWVERQLQHSIRFGRIAAETRVNEQNRIVSFRADAVFALLRSSANDFGSVGARIDILRAVQSGEEHTTVPFVRPGGELFLSLQGWPKVQAALAAIAQIESFGLDPCEVSPDHWRHVHNRLSVGAAPRSYTAQRHAAWLKRKAIEG